MQCHGRIEEVHEQFIEGRLWEEEPHKIPPCVDCHQPHKIRRVFYDAGVATQDCLECHGDPELVVEEDGTHRSLFVDQAVTGGVGSRRDGVLPVSRGRDADLRRAAVRDDRAGGGLRHLPPGAGRRVRRQRARHAGGGGRSGRAYVR